MREYGQGVDDYHVLHIWASRPLTCARTSDYGPSTREISPQRCGRLDMSVTVRRFRQGQRLLERDARALPVVALHFDSADQRTERSHLDRPQRPNTQAEPGSVERLGIMPQFVLAFGTFKKHLDQESRRQVSG